MIKPTRERRQLLRPFYNRLRDFGALTEVDDLLLAQASGDQVVHRRGTDGPIQGLHVITAGWACRMRKMASGRRQIFLFLLPGDAIGTFCAPSEFTFFRTTALTRLETIDMSGLLANPKTLGVHAILEAGLRAEDHAQGFIYGHMMRLGAGDAYCGMAHLLLELHDRLAQAGLVEVAGDFTLPIGQRVLAQALGVSVTHVNNTLQRMASAGLIAFTGRSVRLLQRERMIALSDFEDVIDDPVGKSAPRIASSSYGALTEVSPRCVQPTCDVSPAVTRTSPVAGDLLEA